MQLRSKLGPMVIASVLVLGAAQLALAQVDWTFQGPVVPPGDPGSWDSSRHQLGDVVFDGTTYHMYLVGGQTPLSWESSWRVGHWTWNALTQKWDPDPCNPVLEPEVGEWDAFSIYGIAVLYDGGMFKMWYGAAADPPPGVIASGYATNADGSCDWDKFPGNPLAGLEPGPTGEWDDGGTIPSTVLFDGASYRMWTMAVQTNGTSNDSWRIGTATSPNGLDWTKHPDPVLVGSEPSYLLYAPEVVTYGGGYAMWYSVAVYGVGAAIAYAVSPDGIHWGKWHENPVLSPLPGCNAVDSFAAIVDGDTVHAWTAHCFDVSYVTSPLDVVFFDHFETGDITVWSTVVQ